MTIGVFIGAWVILFVWAFITIKKAPLGYEDENGFHEIKEYPILSAKKDKKIAA